jgi:hypothetical protein
MPALLRVWLWATEGVREVVWCTTLFACVCVLTAAYISLAEISNSNSGSSVITVAAMYVTHTHTHTQQSNTVAALHSSGYACQ